ncbi:MAG: general secretion pathway protein GspB [Pseudomonadota bacterium]
MSYILDAVRKADQERRENLAPVVHSLGAHSHSRMPVKSRLNAHWPAIIAGTLLVNLAGWYWSSNARSTSDKESAIASLEPHAEASVEISNPHATPQAEQPSLQIERLDKVLLWQAPVDAQNAVRSLDFSFHVYADDASRRTIIINGQRVAEKDQISQDLALNEITNNGVVLLYQNSLLIEADILEQW